jgi:hypothetical protein
MTWRQLLTRAVDNHPRGIAGVAEQIGLSRPAISQVLSETYPASTDNIARRVLDHYDRPDCPLVQREIDRPLCRKTALREQPRGGDALTRWTVCQTCPYKPKG